MNDVSTKKNQTNIGQDIWFSGRSDLNGPNGQACYYICHHLEKLHYYENTKTYGIHCKFNDKPIEEVTCGMDCPEFGYCTTCSGFSAIRCQECDIIR